MVLSYQKKLENIMEHVQETGLYVNSFSDIIIGQSVDIPVDANNKVNITLPEDKHYNSVILYTILTCLMKRGSMMYTGGPGIGKTTAAEYISHFVFNIPLKDILDAEIHCNPELTEEKMIARLHTGKLVTTGDEEVKWRNFCKCPIHILDEINRLPPDKADILFNGIDRGIVKYMDQVSILEEGPILVTANYKDAGNFVMTPPFVDRFAVAVRVPKPNALDLEFITDRPSVNLGGSLEEFLLVHDFEKLKHNMKQRGMSSDQIERKVKEIKSNMEKMILSKGDLESIRRDITEVTFEKEARNYIHYLCSQIDFCMMGASAKYNRCAPAFMNKGSCENKQPDTICKNPTCHYYTKDMPCRLTKNEITVRSTLAVYDYSRALAWFLGKKEVTIDVVKEVFPFTSWHRLEPTPTAINEDTSFVNDRVALVRFIMEQAEKGFEVAIAKDGLFESYGSIVNAFEKVERGELPPEDLINKVEINGEAEISQYDDPVKYALACHLQWMHHYILTKYKVVKKKK